MVASVASDRDEAEGRAEARAAEQGEAEV